MRNVKYDGKNKNPKKMGEIYTQIWSWLERQYVMLLFFSVMSCFVFMCERPPRSYVFGIIKKKHINLLKYASKKKVNYCNKNYI